MPIQPRKPGIALVTGSSSGIGRASALALASDGWTVVVTARRQAELDETVKLMKDPKKGLAIAADLSKSEDVVRVFATIKEKFGRLDMLFNNAGMSSRKEPLEDLPLQHFMDVMTVNVTASFQCAQEAFKIMKSQSPQGGRIINNGSISAYTPRPNSAPYTMSKHAILGLTKCLSLDGRKHNIACSQIDIGNAVTGIGGADKSAGMMQANGQSVPEAGYDVDYAGESVAYMASLPLDVNVFNQTLMATSMPFAGRG